MVKHLLTLLIFTLPCVFVTDSADAAVLFSNAAMNQVTCASKKMQLFYYYLSGSADATVQKYHEKGVCGNSTIIMPKWINDKLPEMINRKVWRDPEEGAISEATVWQTPISILYEFFDVTRKTFPSDFGGAGIPPGMLVKEYSDIRIRYQLALDRLYRARTKDFIMGDSLMGRGRTVMATFNLLLKEMESVSDAISSADTGRYAEAILASSVLSQDAFAMLSKQPRVYKPPQKESSLQKMFQVGFTLFGMFLMFMAVITFLGEGKGLENNRSITAFNENVVKYNEAFSRQFIKINVKHLMLAPSGVFGILVLFGTMNLFFTIIAVILGLWFGMKLPENVLKNMKASRGKKIDAQLMDGLILMSNCLRSGLDVVQGFEMVSKDLLPPIADEFGLVIRNYQLGMTFEKALGVLEERVESKMLSYMIRAVILQRQMGGNLTKVFERIVIDIREESKLDEKTKAMTAQQTIQSYVVGFMPWVMTGVMFLFQTETMLKFYTSPLGVGVLFCCIIWVGIGMKLVAATSKIDV